MKTELPNRGNKCVLRSVNSFPKMKAYEVKL